MKHQGSPFPWQASLLALAFACASSQAPGTSQTAGDASPGLASPALASAARSSFADLGSLPITQAAMVYPKRAHEQTAPLSLTASDGTGLRLVSLDAQAVVAGPLAFTELRLRFENPLDRTIEGRFAITLPDGAAISRLAMRLNTGWQEAEVVELQQARRAYEDFLHRRQDPALLEKEAGNEFRARIFPIPARGHKDIILSYSQSLVGTDASYRLPLRGLPAVDHLKVSVLLGQAQDKPGAALGYQPKTLEQRGWVPDQDFVVPLPASVGGLHSGTMVVARVRPEVQTKSRAMERMTILFDTSASRAPGFAGQVERLGSLSAALAEAHGADLPVIVAAFDQGVAEIYRGPLGGFGAAHLDAVRARRPLGASDLHTALAWAGQAAPGGKDGGKEAGNRIVVMTDAIATLGAVEGDGLRAAVQGLVGRVARLDFLLSGGIRDVALAQGLTRGLLPEDGVVLDMDQAPAAELARRLGQSTVSGINVAVDGAAWVWPHTLDGVQPGDEVLIVAERAPAAAGQPARITLSGPVKQTIAVPLAAAAPPLLARATAAARIAMLSARRDALAPEAAAERTRLVREIVDLSIQSRVLSDYTGLLVLESEADYVRFGIDRRALADILTVNERGLTVIQRDKPVLLMAHDQPPAPKPDRARAGSKDKEAKKAEASPADARSTGARRDARADMDMTEDDGVARGGGGAPGQPPPAPPPAPSPATRGARMEMEEPMEMAAADEVSAEERGVEGGVIGGVVGGVVGGVAEVSE